MIRQKKQVLKEGIAYWFHEHGSKGSEVGGHPPF